jgi:hypothetical protein
VGGLAQNLRERTQNLRKRTQNVRKANLQVFVVLYVARFSPS